MTDEQKLTLAIQREIGSTGMRELALNSLRFKAWAEIVTLSKIEEDEIKAHILASIPDDTLSHTT